MNPEVKLVPFFKLLRKDQEVSHKKNQDKLAIQTWLAPVKCP